MRTVADYDRELETLGKKHAEIWGQIQQLRAERNLALAHYARAAARAEPSAGYQPAQWNENGHVNSNFEEMSP
jgi:hypothetical protein